MISRLTLLAMACATSQALYLEKREETTEAKTPTTTTKLSSETATKETTTKKETTTTTTTTKISTKKPEPTTTTTKSFGNLLSTHESSTTHASSTTHVSSGTTVMSMVPTMTSSSSAIPSSTALPEQTSSSPSSGGIIGGIVAAVIVLVVAVGAFLLVRRKKARRALRAQRNKPDPFTMGFGSDDPRPLEHFEAVPIQYEEDHYKQQYQPQLSPQPQNTLPVNAATAATVLAATPTAPETTTTATTAAIVNPNPTVLVSPAPNPIIEEHKSLGLFTVIATYIPTLSDELEIESGDQIDLIVEYDDGWCQGINLSKGNTKGVFPRHCIDYATVPSHHVPNFEAENSKRVSSMYVM